MPLGTTFISDGDSDNSGPDWDHNYYRSRVQRGADWDTTAEYRYAVADAKDRARNAMIRAIKTAEQELSEQSLTTFSLSYLTNSDDVSNATFSDEASKLVTREIDGAQNAPYDDIVL